jgi:hypothetical protein
MISFRVPKAGLLPVAVTIAILLSSCGTAEPGPPTARFREQTFHLDQSVGYAINPTDLSPIGEVDSIDDSSWVTSLTVYELDGVDPAQLVIMFGKRPENGEYVLLYRREAVPTGAPDEAADAAQARFIRAFPGLCRYYPEVACPQ